MGGRSQREAGGGTWDDRGHDSPRGKKREREKTREILILKKQVCSPIRKKGLMLTEC